MTGPRIPTVHPHRRRARHLLPFLLAIVAGPLACTGDQPTGPASAGGGPSVAPTRMHPNLASKAGQSAGAMRAAFSRASLSTAAAVLPPSTGTNVLILADVEAFDQAWPTESSSGLPVAVKRAPSSTGSGAIGPR